MRWLVAARREDGAFAVLTAILIVVLIGFVALAIDVARMYQERRELQRTADVAALSGASVFRGAAMEAVAEGTAVFYVGKNPTENHPGPFAPPRDRVDARPRGCRFGAADYDCVYTRVVAAGMPLLFARAFGLSKTRIAADARAIIASGAPGGDKLVPWLLIDCPNPARYPDEADPRVLADHQRVHGAGTCPYVFNDNWDTGRRALFLESAREGNFQGADLAAEPDCPPPNGYFQQRAGASEYEALLSGSASPEIPCNIWRGARVHTKTGAMVGPTRTGIRNRGVGPSCMNRAAFEAALGGEGDGDGFVTIENPNPCIVALIMGVHTDPAHPMLKQPSFPGDVDAMQHPQAWDSDGDGEWRFGDFSRGTSKVMIVRRFAFFYITATGGPGDAYEGLFLQAFDTLDAELGGPYDPDSGILVTRLVD